MPPAPPRVVLRFQLVSAVGPLGVGVGAPELERELGLVCNAGRHGIDGMASTDLLIIVTAIALFFAIAFFGGDAPFLGAA